jgi:uncharacterized protein (DUF4415 family)
MVEIPLPPRSHHKANKLTDEEQEERNKRLGYSSLTKGWVKKKKDECFYREVSRDLQKKFQGAVRLIYPATLYPVCPAMRQLLKEEKARGCVIDVQFIDEIKRSCNDSTVQYFPLWASIFRILRVLDSLRIGSKPSLETVVRYIHTENLLKRQLDSMRGDLLVLPQRLEKDYLKTSNECKELIARYKTEIANIAHGNQLSAFLVPDGLKDANLNWTWTTFLTWRRDQIGCTRSDYQAKMLSLTRYYPIEAIKAMLPLYNALSPILRILSEQMAAGNQCNANLKKMIEELSAKLTKPAEKEQKRNADKSDIKPKAETWEQITIEIVDNDTIKYKANGKKWERANCTQLGFLDKRKHLPNTLWPKFLSLAVQNKPKQNHPHITNKNIDNIRETLRGFFGLQEIPIKYDRKNKKFCCIFSFYDNRNW